MKRKQTYQRFESAIGECITCGANTQARNALAWTHNHVRANPTHLCGYQVAYFVGHVERHSAQTDGSKQDGAVK